jgi:hypothetical protein
MIYKQIITNLHLCTDEHGLKIQGRSRVPEVFAKIPREGQGFQ